MEVAPASEPSSFGKYTLVAKLATGGMAEIFLARLLSDGGFEKLVCIKRILPHLAKDPQFVAMFLDEARVVARISHPNVCQVFELGEISGQYYIAMEYLAGVPLSAFRRVDYYPWATDPRLVAAFGIQACEGLHHAHQLKAASGEQLGVVHRDISPQNMFVTFDGIVKVLDFGIAKVQDQSVRTSTGAVKGTYSYMSPEQLRGEKVDRRADVWALGTVLWETLAQRHLFKRDTEFLTFQAITTDPIPDICEVRPDVPPLLGDTIARAISRDREMRFPTARALGEALHQAVGPLGGPLATPAIADEVERAFQDLIAEQRELLERARLGDTFDLERSNPLKGKDLGTTPVSNIKHKLAAAQAEVEQYVRAQAAIRSLEDDEPSASGFTPPPNMSWEEVIERRKRLAISDGMIPPEVHAEQTIADSNVYNVAPKEWRRRDSTPMPAALPPRTSGQQAVVVKHSKLPWIISCLAVGVAVTVVSMVIMNRGKTEAPAKVADGVGSAPAPAAGSAVTMATVRPDAAVAAPEDAMVKVVEVVELDAGVAAPDAPAKKDTVAAIEKPRPPPVVERPKDKDKKEPIKIAVKEPAPSGPPGWITIDSTPYAVIFIDGKRMGETPLVHIALAPGKHAVKAVAPSKTTQNLSITIESGKTAATRKIEW